MAKVNKAKKAASGSVVGEDASNKRVPSPSKGSPWYEVQQRTIAGAKGKAVLKKDKELGATSMAKDGKWIQKAIKKPGALRKSLGAKPGKPIPAGKLAAAAKKPGKLGQRARLAQTLKKMKKK